MVEHTAENRGVAGSNPALAPFDRRLAPGGAKSVHQRLDEVVLDEDGVGAGFADSFVDSFGRVAREGDEARVRVIAPKACDRRDAVEERHVEIDHDRIRLELIRELDRIEPVCGDADDPQVRLAVDDGAQRIDETRVVVGEQDADGCRHLAG